MFQHLPEAECIQITAAMQPFALEANAVLVQQGDHSRWVYFIENGSVKVARSKMKNINSKGEIFYEESHNGPISEIVGCGGCVGELSVVDGIDNLHSAVALEKVQGQRLAADKFEYFLHNLPGLTPSILWHMGRMVRYHVWQEEILHLHNVNGAVSAQLLLIGYRYGQTQDDNSVLLPFPLRQNLLASLTGHGRESVNKTINLFIALGYIEKRPQFRILLKDRDALIRVHLQAVPRR